MNDNKNIHKFGFYVLLILTLGATIYVTSDFVMTIILAFVFANVFMPLHTYLKNKIKLPDQVVAVITMLITFLVFFIPIAYFTGVAANQVVKLISDIDNVLGFIPDFNLEAFDRNQLINSDQLVDFARNLATGATNRIFGNFQQIGAIPLILFSQILIFIFTYFASLVNGHKLVTIAKKALPLDEDIKNRVFEQVNIATKSTFLSIFTGAFAQTVSVLAMFIFLDVEYAFLWSILTFVSAMLPTGSGIVTIPMGIVFLFTGRVVDGIILLVYQAVFVSTIDNVVRAMTGARDTKLNSTLSLVALAGGVFTFGIIGIILGPLIYVVSIEMLEIYLEKTSGVKSLEKIA